jgi:hypothetical protein
MKDIETAKKFLITGDAISYLAAPSDLGIPSIPIAFDLSVQWAPEELLSLSTAETLNFNDMPMNLIVKKPDYLGTSMWEFRHGRTPISARINDVDCLKRFQNREIDVRPGDALKCRVSIERKYGFDNELISDTYTITKVVNVLPNQLGQANLWSDNP